MNKRFLQVISAALCVLLLAGCGAKAEDSAGTADDGQQWGTSGSGRLRRTGLPDHHIRQHALRSAPRRADRGTGPPGGPVGPGGDAGTAVEPDVTVTTQWAEGQQGEGRHCGCGTGLYDPWPIPLRAAPDMTVEEHPCCTDDMVDELRFYAFMMSSDLSFRTRAAATLENLTPSASDNIRVRVLIDAQEATGNITDTAYCQDEHWSTARELALTRLNGRWTVTDDDTDASIFSRVALRMRSRPPGSSARR